MSHAFVMVELWINMRGAQLDCLFVSCKSFFVAAQAEQCCSFAMIDIWIVVCRENMPSVGGKSFFIAFENKQYPAYFVINSSFLNVLIGGKGLLVSLKIEEEVAFLLVELYALRIQTN